WRNLFHHGVDEFLRIDILANAANFAVFELEDKTVLVFVLFAVGYFAAVGQFDDHGVAVAVDAPEFALEPLRKHGTDARHELEDFVLALLETRNTGSIAGNQPADVIVHIRERALDVALAEEGPGPGHEFLVLFRSHSPISFSGC